MACIGAGRTHRLLPPVLPAASVFSSSSAFTSIALPLSSANPCCCVCLPPRSSLSSTSLVSDASTSPSLAVLLAVLLAVSLCSPCDALLYE